MLARNVAGVAARHVFRSQIANKNSEMLENLGIPIYFTDEDFRLRLAGAIRIIAVGDKDAYAEVRRYLGAIVQVSDNVVDVNFDSAALFLGAFFGRRMDRDNLAKGEKATACALVQFVVNRKLLINLSERCPRKDSRSIRKKIVRISLERMYRFTVHAGFESKYSYEIECKLKSGAFDC